VVGATLLILATIGRIGADPRAQAAPGLKAAPQMRGAN
jgi:hypothetical protein